MTMDTRRLLQPVVGISGPVVIGGVGGSETRVLTEILSHAGIAMGIRVDPKTHDSLPMRRFLNAEFESLVAESFAESSALPDRIYAGLLAAVAEHRQGMSTTERWGWKNPRTMWLIPILAQIFPSLRFILLARDGRDVALSENRFLLESAGHVLLGGRSFPSVPHAQLALWERGTRWALDAGARHLGGNFSIVRYEALCAAPEQTLRQLFEFLGLPDPVARASGLASRVVPSSGIGRGRHAAPVAAVPGALEVLQALGYEA